MSFGPRGRKKQEAEALRATVFAELEALGFRIAPSLPFPDMDRPVRPAAEVAARLMALNALFIWVAVEDVAVASERLQKHIDGNRLRDWLADDEREILALPRERAQEEHADTIGWKLENMWDLAWVLGFDPAPGLEASQVGDEVTEPLLFEFLPGLDGTRDALLSTCAPRSADEVIALEYRFYCAHNAVRSAQLGHDSVPAGFDPLSHGGAVQERRHALSWSLSPGVAWDRTDLST